jgi:O-antigen/teichoic acid export membrane protein
MKSYTQNYIKIYATQSLSMLLGFMSLFVVVPYLSADKITYGIYTVCVSISIFLSYADLGFLGAGMKYAAECYSREEKEKEIALIGFTHFILLIFVLLLCGVFLFFSFNLIYL